MSTRGAVMEEKRWREANSPPPRRKITLLAIYHQGVPATRAASVPSPAQSAISLSLMEPSFLDRLTAPGPQEFDNVRL